jgi:hypothetical protein
MQRERYREIKREKVREVERDKEKESEREIERERETETDRETKRETETERGRERKIQFFYIDFIFYFSRSTDISITFIYLTSYRSTKRTKDKRNNKTQKKKSIAVRRDVSSREIYFPRYLSVQDNAFLLLPSF